MKIKEKKHRWIIFLYYFFRIFPIQKNKVVFSNYVGKGYGCNPKYIAEELLKRGGDWDLVWLVNDITYSFPQKIRVIKQETIQAVYEAATAGFWIDNQRKLSYHKKRKNQYFIETWHGGGGPLKKIGADNPQNLDNLPYLKTSLHMDKITDVMISNSTCCSKIYRSAFLYHGEIFECGYPRNDILVSNQKNIKEAVYKNYKLENTIKTVLYAPTYRNTRDLTPYTIDYNGVLLTLKKKFGGDWKFLLRLHPTMTQKPTAIECPADVIQVSNYDDMQELLVTADVLISDYSSVISEYALTDKPIFLFATDISTYTIERDFYWNYYSLPFPIAKNNKELKTNISMFNEVIYLEKVHSYLKQVGMKETGTASIQIVNRMEQQRNKIKKGIKN